MRGIAIRFLIVAACNLAAWGVVIGGAGLVVFVSHILGGHTQ